MWFSRWLACSNYKRFPFFYNGQITNFSADNFTLNFYSFRTSKREKSSPLVRHSVLPAADSLVSSTGAVTEASVVICPSVLTLHAKNFTARPATLFVQAALFEHSAWNKSRQQKFLYWERQRSVTTIDPASALLHYEQSSLSSSLKPTSFYLFPISPLLLLLPHKHTNLTQTCSIHYLFLSLNPLSLLLGSLF